MAKTPTLFCDDGSEVALPFTWHICSNCAGHGMSSAYLGAYTQQEMDDAGPEFYDDYMAGRYDRACDDCDGTGKIKVINRAKLSKAHREAWDDQCEADAFLRAEEAAERRMGC